MEIVINKAETYHRFHQFYNKYQPMTPVWNKVCELIDIICDAEWSDVAIEALNAEMVEFEQYLNSIFDEEEEDD